MRSTSSTNRFWEWKTEMSFQWFLLATRQILMHIKLWVTFVDILLISEQLLHVLLTLIVEMPVYVCLSNLFFSSARFFLDDISMMPEYINYEMVNNVQTWIYKECKTFGVGVSKHLNLQPGFLQDENSRTPELSSIYSVFCVSCSLQLLNLSSAGGLFFCQFGFWIVNAQFLNVSLHWEPCSFKHGNTMSYTSILL